MLTSFLYTIALTLICSHIQGALAENATTFVFQQNLFASDTGYYQVVGYQGVSPQLNMRKGVTYRFDQTDPTNWYHPLGFAYAPDGAHACLESGGCPEIEHSGLQYFIDGQLSDLDTYEPSFEVPLEEWREHEYYVELTLPEDEQNYEVFYFCHLHTGMSGRIQVEQPDGSPVAVPEGSRSPLYQPYVPDSFDAKCGTFEVGDYSASSGGYEEKCGGLIFLCGETQSNFAQCMQAIDCKMNREMRVVNDANPVVTFMRQMVPHHDNAVNMAKILLKIELDAVNEGKTDAEKVLQSDAYNIIDEDVDDLLRNIVNSQNEQITFMNTWLVENGYEPYDRRGGNTRDKTDLCPPGPATTNM